MFIFDTALEVSPSVEYLALLELEVELEDELEVEEELELNSIKTQTSPGIPHSSNSFFIATSLL